MTRRSPRPALRHGTSGRVVPLGELARPFRRLTKTAAMNALGPVVYAIRLDDDIIKIGLTGALQNRISTLKARERSVTAELLGFTPGDEATEAALHGRLAPHLAHGREYYHRTPEVMAVVNEMRASLGLDPLDGARE